MLGSLIWMMGCTGGFLAHVRAGSWILRRVYISYRYVVLSDSSMIVSAAITAPLILLLAGCTMTLAGEEFLYFRPARSKRSAKRS